MDEMWTRFGAALMAAGVLAACEGNSPAAPSYSCTVTIEKQGDSNPHPRIFIQTVVQTGTGSGTGSTQNEALAQARQEACSMLDITSSERAACERGTSPDVVAGLKLLIETSQRCSGGSSG